MTKYYVNIYGQRHGGLNILVTENEEECQKACTNLVEILDDVQYHTTMTSHYDKLDNLLYRELDYFLDQ